MSTITPQLIRNCPSCGKDVPLGTLACSECHALLHKQELEALAREAQSLAAKGRVAEAREIWQRCLALLPSESKQAEWVSSNLRTLEATENAQAGSQNNWAKKLGPLGPLALLLAKSKGILLAIFKLKFLLSLGSFVALYWAMFGWRFGAGFAASILIHELGHYIDIKRRGWPAEMPVFLPGLGAYVRWQALGATLSQRAQVSLAGPLAGWLAAAACTWIYIRTGSLLWLSLGRTGAVLNILNLIPVWILDGGQAVKALARPERITLLAASLALWVFTGEGIFFLVALGTAWSIFNKDRPSISNWNIFLYYAAVLAALGILLRVLPASAAS